MRELISFPCQGDALAGTLDDAAGSTGLLIVSGGNEIRCGAHRGMALLAADLAASGIPVFRFDRRGIGDSEGANHGYADSGPDIAAAVTAFRTVAPQVKRIVGFGNCDAATALALFHREAGIESLVLANPWVGDEGDDLPPADAIRSHYADRVRDPKQWLRLVSGGINIGKVIKGLRKASAAIPEVSNPIAERMATALGDTPHRFLLANRDNTAIRFASAWPHGGDKRECATDSHSFARAGDAAWLANQLREALA
ncbi:hydrolase 1, exosortase A system-associated [Sphingomonas bacterium]|uniref:hydrolase 1, exosortase A system-associated n=1 Tax=Sphingomonas bacterium TaxID=1895847 RepID=UPI00260F0A9C|nr:hydrolase 1, exosortase A system-associated [Sphingomonas bacterium]MDB5678000.1 hydrolase 1, exosortase system-associated [Sphingomonas bacterium]